MDDTIQFIDKIVQYLAITFKKSKIDKTVK